MAIENSDTREDIMNRIMYFIILLQKIGEFPDFFNKNLEQRGAIIEKLRSMYYRGVLDINEDVFTHGMYLGTSRWLDNVSYQGDNINA